MAFWQLSASRNESYYGTIAWAIPNSTDSKSTRMVLSILPLLKERYGEYARLNNHVFSTHRIRKRNAATPAHSAFAFNKKTTDAQQPPKIHFSEHLLCHTKEMQYIYMNFTTE